MEIMNCEWESRKNFDDKLLEIDVYKKHPSLLPFIGRHYEKIHILLVGESHYLDSEEDEIAKSMEDWYYSPTSTYNFKYPGNLDTRFVVNNYLNGRRSKAHSMFRNPAKALVDAWELKDINDSEAFTSFAFMNFFQRPEANTGESINLNEYDKQVAYETLNKVIEIIEPIFILFLSKKAFECYKDLAKDKVDSRVDYVYHPTSEHWNDEDGKEKAVQCFKCLKKVTSFNGYTTNGHLLLSTIMPVLEEKNYHIIKKNHKRFLDDKITVSIYTEKDSNTVSEVVWHVEDNNIWFGIGYIIDIKTVWIWNYTKKEYLTEAEAEQIQKLNDLYKNVNDIISNLPN